MIQNPKWCMMVGSAMTIMMLPTMLKQPMISPINETTQPGVPDWYLFIPTMPNIMPPGAQHIMPMSSAKMASASEGGSVGNMGGICCGVFEDGVGEGVAGIDMFFGLGYCSLCHFAAAMSRKCFYAFFAEMRIVKITGKWILLLLCRMTCARMRCLLTKALFAMNLVFKTLVVSIVAIASWVQALELSDLRLPLTRTEADNFSKDYEYEVLSDHSVRRTWRMSGKKIAIDFESKTDNAICITVTYNEPAPRKEGLADAKVLAGDKVDKSKWKEVKSAAALKFGMSHAEALQLSDGSFLFREVTNDKKKRFTRLSLYAKMPKENRSDLAVLDATGGKTALGSATVGTEVKELYEDEAKRRGAGAAVAVAEVEKVEPTPSNYGPRVTALGSTPGARAAQRRQREEEAAQNAASAQQTAPVASAVDADDEEEGDKKRLKDRTLVEALGLDNPGPVQFGVIGGIVLLLVVIIVARNNAAKRKAAQQAKFTAVLMHNHRSGAPKVKRK